MPPRLQPLPGWDIFLDAVWSASGLSSVACGVALPGYRKTTHSIYSVSDPYSRSNIDDATHCPDTLLFTRLHSPALQSEVAVQSSDCAALQHRSEERDRDGGVQRPLLIPLFETLIPLRTGSGFPHPEADAPFPRRQALTSGGDPALALPAETQPARTAGTQSTSSRAAGANVYVQEPWWKDSRSVPLTYDAEVLRRPTGHAPPLAPSLSSLPSPPPPTYTARMTADRECNLNKQETSPAGYCPHLGWLIVVYNSSLLTRLLYCRQQGPEKASSGAMFCSVGEARARG